MTVATEVAPPPLPRYDEVVTFWDITRKQFSKNTPAVVALWCVIGLVIVATAAPLITMNIPFVMWGGENGRELPLFENMFNRLVFPSGVDVFFNLLIFVAPIWWLGSRLARRCGLEDRQPDKKGILLNGIPLGILVAFCFALGGVVERVYLYVTGMAVIGVLLMFIQSARVPGLLPRQVRRMRTRTRFVLGVLFAAIFAFTLLQWSYTRTVRDYRTEIAALRENGDGGAISPPLFFHPDNAGEEGSFRFTHILQKPSFETGNLLGCDNNGRDVFSRILFGTRISLTIGIIAVSIYVTIGIVLGSIAGYFGGKTDLFILFVVQVMLCIPSMFLLLTIVAVFESRNIFMIMIAIGLVRWTGVTRLVRGEFMRQRNIDYVMAARALGIPQRKVIFGHILKNALSPVLVAAAFGVAAAILTESGLAFIGLGDTNAPSWGQMLLEGRNHRKDWLIFSPGLAIFFVVTVLNMVGDGLRDALDPRLRQ